MPAIVLLMKIATSVSLFSLTSSYLAVIAVTDDSTKAAVYLFFWLILLVQSIGIC